MEALESVPEGSGTMMDHTLIVYTSNNADKQHTTGANWPVMLLGNFDGAFKTGCFTQLDGKPTPQRVVHHAPPCRRSEQSIAST